MQTDNASGDMESAVIGKVVWRLFPFMILLTMVNFIDRVNIGFAALTMNKDLGIDPAAFGFAAGIFFLGYVLFEVPSNVSCTASAPIFGWPASCSPGAWYRWAWRS